MFCQNVDLSRREENMRFGAKVTVFAVAAVFVATSGWAFNPVEENSQWEIPRAGAPTQAMWETHQVDDVRSMATVPVEAFADRHGGDWFYQVNRSTGTYHHVYGSGIDLGVTLNSEQAAENLARDFIRDNQSLFSINEQDLDVMRSHEGLGKRSVIFQQLHQGLKVWGGRVHLVFTDSGRLFEMGSDAYTGIEISPVPGFSESDALGIAKSDIGFQEGYDEITRSELMVLPLEIGEEAMEYRLAYRFDLKMEDPFGIWATWVDGNTGEILWRENHIRFIDFTGHVQGDVEWESYCDGYTTDYPLKNMQINITDVGNVLTDVNGDFTLTYGGSDSKTITAEFRGPWMNVDRYTGTDASHSGTITPGVPYTIDWNSSNSLDAERDVFAYVNKQHDWLKEIDPTFTGCDYEMTGWVERTDGYCPGNAWWDGVAINLCAQGSGYGNTGRMADVVYHEYGHGVTDFLYGGSDPPSDMHEGNSDIIANYLTRESIMGLGFYLDDCVSGIRNSDNSMTYPCGGSGHTCGQVIAGFHWDSWQELLAGYAQAYADSVAMYTWHHGRSMGLPQTQPDQVHWTFVADDDDGNLTNGTPHYDEFCVGATNHSFTCPTITVGVFITHTPLDNTSNTSTPYPVTAVMTSTEGAIDVADCRVTFRVDGGAFVDSGMTATGNPDEYVGYIAAQPACSQVEYYIYAEDVLANSATDPASAPAGLYPFLVGYTIAIDDDFETDQGWTAGLPGDDATTGMWERCDPEGTEAQAENDNTASGVNAYITHCAAGASQGIYDVDGGKTTLLSPVFDLTSQAEATVTYYRWYSNDTGAEPGQDYWVVDITDDNGASWVNLENTNVSDRSWALQTFDIGTYVGLTDSVRFRFIASDFDPGSLVEAGVDDFLIVGCSGGGDTEPPVVTVVDPNGGEVIVGGGGSQYPIEWTSSDNVGVTVTHILLSTDGGASYPDTVDSGALVSPYDWTVPALDEPDCRIKVVCLDAALNEGDDASDADFAIVDVAGTPLRPLMPADVVLFQNRPTPFRDVTEIEFGLPSSQMVSLDVYTVEGRLVATLARGTYPGGYHTVAWHGTDTRGAEVAGGMYFYRLETEERSLTRKMMMLK